MRVLVLAAPYLRGSYLGCYGCDWVRTPHLDRLAAEAIVFDQHFADSPSSQTSFQALSDIEPNRSWWMGRYFLPADHDPPGEAAPRLPMLLQANGIRLLRIVSRSRMAGAPGTPSLAFPTRRLLAALEEQRSASRLLVWVDLPGLAPPWPELRTKRLRAYFPSEDTEDEETPAPWLNPPHGMLDPAENLALERLQASYAAMVTYFDAQLGKLFRELRARNGYDDLLLIITSDRGLGLGEHGFIGTTAPALHEESIHVPLLMRLPGGAEAGRRVSALTQAVDLFPTFLEALDLPDAEAQGRSLFPLVRGTFDDIRAYACAAAARTDGVAYTLRTAEWSLVLPAQVPPGRPQLYVKPDDRWEVNDVAQHHPDLAQRLEQTLRGFVAATRQPGLFHPPPFIADPTQAAAEPGA